MFGFQISNSCLRFRLGIKDGILVWDSGFGFRFGTRVRDSCWEFQLLDSV